ncbi:MAG: methylated-DNA--[protein]-cysteine S-methyltransferase [Victivallaceae bacterium]|nr:methylated-DNA--[protein]-cysteine S-methyltransferase [Victivallaceae bacterium]
MFITIDSPLGKLTLHEESGALARLVFGEADYAGVPVATALLTEAAEQLLAYFAGTLRLFELPLAPSGTEFERSVWRSMLEIPYGETRSYAELAAMAGRMRACRATGTACGHNPLPILIPCHRVVRSDGGEGGYSAGIAIKRFLLELERRFSV